MRCELLSVNECTEVQSAILDEIKLCQQKDTQCRRIIDGKLNRNDERFNFTVENNIVYSNQRYFIPNNATLKNKLLQLYHDRLGHQGVSKTFELIGRMCVWPKMFEEGKNYVPQCSLCQ